MEIIVKGKVSSGFGKGKFFTQVDWVVQEFLTKFGFVPFPGTLNTDIFKKDWQDLIKLWQDGGVKIEQKNNSSCFAICHTVQINHKVDGVVVIPCVTEHPKGRLEIVAPINIRNSLKLSNDDVITLTFKKWERGVEK